jgi:mono/diheme cytochrome c family protein
MKKRIDEIVAACVMALTTATFAAAILTGCGGPRGVTPTIAPAAAKRAQTDASFERGQLVFMQNCNSCHPAGGAGLGPHIHELPVTNGMIAMQVRAGLGIMPAFDESQISDAQLADLVHYLDEVEEVGPMHAKR